MSGLAVAVSLDGTLPRIEDVKAMASAAGYRAPSRLRDACCGSAAGVYLDGSEEPGVRSSSPLVSSDSSLLVVADARIDNRRDVAAALGRPDIELARDDGALVLEAYRRWGESFADRFAGDFAIVVWDAAARRLVAARDAMGMRPLCYRIESGRILVASEPQQILAAIGVPSDLNERHIAAVLAGSPGLPEWTFYEGVHRLPPGHTLVADARGKQVRDRSFVDADALQRLSDDDHLERFRATLTDAVRARLEVTGTGGLMLSGGLDSTAIAGVAGALRAKGTLGSDLRTYSFAYDDLPECDERETSDLVVAHYGMPSVAIPTAGAWPLADHPAHGPDRNGPDRLRSHVVFERTLAAAQRDGVTLLMSGHRGDSIAGGVVDYLGLLRERGPGAFWRGISAHNRRTGISRSAILRDHVVRRIPSALWPGRMNPWARRHLRRALRPIYLPPWLRPEAITRFEMRDLAEQHIPPLRLAGEARRRRYQLIFDAQHGRNAEAIERMFARSGIRHSDPWGDRRLVALVLQMPQHLITPAGEAKRLLRDAMKGLLPEAARLAAAKRSPQPFYERGLLDRSSTAVWSLIDGSVTASRGLVDEDILKATYARLLGRQQRLNERDWRVFWRFLDVESWLRRFHS